MTTIHLTDAQRDTFAASGLIVIDPEPHVATISGELYWAAPEGWRILTEPAWVCEECGADWTYGEPQCRRCGNRTRLPGGRRVVTLTATCPLPHNAPGWIHGNLGEVVTLGRFTIPALLPVADAHHMAPDVEPGGVVIEVADGSLWMMPKDQPLPRPAQFIARPERVA